MGRNRIRGCLVASPQELEAEPDEERCRHDPEESAWTKRRGSIAAEHNERGEHDREDGEVGEVRVDVRAANGDRHMRLELRVQKEERDGGRDDEGASRDRHAAAHYTLA